MSAVTEDRDIVTPTGRLSQQSQPSAHHKVSFVGGYLSPLGRSDPHPLDPTGITDNASSLRRLTGAEDRPLPYQRIVTPVVSLPRMPRRAHLNPLQHWEGVVEIVTEDSFLARLHDRRHPGRPEEAEIPLSDVAEGDLELMTPGAVFYWTIGYLVTPGGQRTRTSTIRFRRLPVWTDQELKDAETRAADTKRLLGWT